MTALEHYYSIQKERRQNFGRPRLSTSKETFESSFWREVFCSIDDFHL